MPRNPTRRRNGRRESTSTGHWRWRRWASQSGKLPSALSARTAKARIAGAGAESRPHASREASRGITDWPLGNRSRTCRREHGGADAQLSRIRGRLSGGRLVRTVKPILLAIVFALLDDLRRVLLRPYDPHVSGSSRGFQRSLSMRGRQSQLRRPARLAKGSAAVVTDASDGHRGRVSADGDLDGRRASGVAFEVVAIPYGNVVGSSPCLFLKSKFIRKIAGSRR